MLFVAACGGNDSLSAEAYFDAIEDLGAAAEARVGGVSELSLDDAESVAAFLDNVQAVWAGVRADLAALAAPTELASIHNAYVDAVDAVIGGIERLRGAGARQPFDAERFDAELGDALNEFAGACFLLQAAANRGADFLSLACAPMVALGN